MSDSKEERAEHVEHVDHYSATRKSALDSLTIPQAFKAYKVAAMYATIAAFSAMCDGYQSRSSPNLFTLHRSHDRGFQVNLNGSIIANKGFIRQFGTVFTKSATTGTITTSLNPKYVSVWGGMQSVGQVIGMTSSSFVSDYLGRKNALYIIWVVMCASVIVECVAKNWSHWLGAKILAGVGVGAMQATLPPYIAEIAPTQLRGALVNAYSAWFVVGQILAPTILQQENKRHPLIFRPAIYSQWAFLGVLIVLWAIIPESPWWHAGKGNEERGKATLRRLNGSVPGYDVNAEWDIMKATIEHERIAAEKLKTGSFVNIFYGTNGWRTLIACWPKCCQQLTGLSLVNSYATYFFQLAGNKDPFRVTVILACTQIASVILVSLYTDTGRRTATWVGYAITSLSVLAIGIIGTQAYTSAPLGSLLIFFACSAIFFNTVSGAIGYVYLAETPTQHWRARTAGFGAAVGACFGVCFSFSVPIMLKGAPKWGVKTGFFFGITGTIATIIAYFILPECAQRTTAEIDEMFEKKVAPRDFAKFDTDVQKAWRSDQVAAARGEKTEVRHEQ
ncbi:BZ3500_MvSof-1268-A1-R1_Chr3-2g06225 [Microbotryum saponariae]|uniref:BZ3500_MvSof-1268-A1-R1_Chr3-2g06225 protein n=1 Tax=Microbotryum saponariae TaxID=289078 RepID=A0A2X0LXK1_9BASI|nr:BZ3500_MvSof-1268-A1-R1_Chr3-2g06225 [Microbotryum saponariae]SDA04153.1 BZ3501_MvSof-1269-A2-R1_Chr3-2g05916 [Microbotryum saponariae]